MKKLVLAIITILIMTLSTGCSSERPTEDQTLPGSNLPEIVAPLPSFLPEITIPEESMSENEERPPATTEEETASFAEESATEQPKYTFTEIEPHSMYTNASANVRSLPSNEEGETYFTLGIDEEVWVISKCNETEWFKVLIEGHECYIDSQFLSESKITRQAPTTTVVATTAKTYNTAGFVYYSVAGVYPNKDYEQYLYSQLKNLGIAWWYPYAVAQIFQESRWNPKSTNGQDHGICQFKGAYFQSRAKNYAGMNNADIWNPYDSLKVYAYYVKAILSSHGNNVDRTLSFYFSGSDAYWSQDYINRVMNWYKQLKAQ